MTDGDKLDNLPCGIEYRDDGAVDKIGCAVFFPVFDDPFPYFFGRNSPPQLLKDRRRHIGMADDIVGSSDKLLFCVPGNTQKLVVDIGNESIGIGFGDDVALIHGLLVAVKQGKVGVELFGLKLRFLGQGGIEAGDVVLAFFDPVGNSGKENIGEIKDHHHEDNRNN